MAWMMTIDWQVFSAVMSAVSTVALTAITAYYAWSTRQILRATARQASAAEQTVELIAADQRRRLEQCRAPIYDGIKRGQSIVDAWLQSDFREWQAPNSWPDSRDLELPELADLILQARSVWFPLYVALSRVDAQIVRARFMIDELAAAPDEEAFFDCVAQARDELLKLKANWAAAETELTGWS